MQSAGKSGNVERLNFSTIAWYNFVYHPGISFDIRSDDVVALNAWDQALPGVSPHVKCFSSASLRTMSFALRQVVSAGMTLSEA